MNETPAFSVLYIPAALKELSKLDKTLARRITAAVERLITEPRPAGARGPVGFPGLFRLRVGDYRVVNAVKGVELLVPVLHVAHRLSVYRRS